MKLATERNGDVDGRLLVVSRDLACAARVPGVATMQDAMDRWDEVITTLQSLYDQLNMHPEDAGGIPLSDLVLGAPFPRAWQWLDGSVFPTHLELMTTAFNLDPYVPEFPLMYQGVSDRFLGPEDDVPLPAEEDGIDFEGEFAVVTGPVPMGLKQSGAIEKIRLLLQINDWSLRAVGQREMKTGFGWVQAKPACSMAPIAVTPDEVGDLWQDGRLRAWLEVDWNGKRFGSVRADEMGYGFDALIEYAARTRFLPAGTIIGSGTISAKAAREVGNCCIAERRAIEMIDTGEISTSFMHFGDTVRMRGRDADGAAIFGEINQKVVRAG